MMDIVSLVKLGFAGFAAAMAVLSYRLIHLQAKRKNPDILTIESLRSFTKYTLYLSLVVVAATTIDRGFEHLARAQALDDTNKARVALISSQQAQDCRETLSGGIGAEAANRSAERLHEILRLTHAKCFSAMKSLEALR